MDLSSWREGEGGREGGREGGKERVNKGGKEVGKLQKIVVKYCVIMTE